MIIKSLELAALWYKKGYTIPLSHVAEILQVSTRWIKEVILPNIIYITYELYGSDYKQLHSKKDFAGRFMTNGIYINKNDLNDFVINKCKVEIQTEVIDMYSYLEGNPKKKIEVYKLYKEKYDSYVTGFGRLPKSVIEFINKNYHKNHLENLSVKKHVRVDKQDNTKVLVRKSGRNDERCSWQEYKDKKNIDIFRNDLYFPKHDLIDGDNVIKAGEHIYRYAYLHGDIRIKIGDGKVIFVKNSRKYNEFKMPFTIPYQMSISRY